MLPFSIISNTDIPIRPMITGTGSAVLESVAIPFFYGTRAVVVGNLMYYQPGYSRSSFNGAADFYSYNMDTGENIKLANTLVVLTLPWIAAVGGSIYMGSGRINNATSGAYNKTVYRYDISTNTWSSVGTSLGYSYTNATSIGTNIYASRPNFIDVYDTLTSSTTSFSCPFGSDGVSAYSSYCFIGSNGVDTIYVNGTTSATTKPSGNFYSYNINTSLWTNLGVPTDYSKVGPIVYNSGDNFVYEFGPTNSLYAVQGENSYVIPSTRPSVGTRDWTCGIYYNSALYLLSASGGTYNMIKFV